MVVLVTGANGQLGQAIHFIAKNYPEIDFVFCDSATLDITNIDSCNQIFATYTPDYCVNTAAYTAVDRAETEQEKAFAVNVLGAKSWQKFVRYMTRYCFMFLLILFLTEKNNTLYRARHPSSNGSLRTNKTRGRTSHSANLGEALYCAHFMGVFSIWRQFYENHASFGRRTRIAFGCKRSNRHTYPCCRLGNLFGTNLYNQQPTTSNQQLWNLQL